MGGLIFVGCVVGVIYNLCKDAKIHNTPVIGSKKDIITTHPERYRNYLECQKICSNINRGERKQKVINKSNNEYLWELVQESIEKGSH
jgi:hypothetical protein